MLLKAEAGWRGNSERHPHSLMWAAVHMKQHKVVWNSPYSIGTRPSQMKLDPWLIIISQLHTKMPEMSINAPRRLPPEIIIGIIEHLESISDLKAVRRSSKFLAATAEVPLFETLVVFFSSASFERARSVARHPRLRQYVKRISYVANRFVPHMNLDQWVYHYRHQNNQMNAAVWLRRPFMSYCKIADEQHVGTPFLSVARLTSKATYSEGRAS
jgi:hypothetical protein